MVIMHTEASTAWGGQEIRTITEGRELKKRGHSVVVAAPPESSILAYAERAGLASEPVPMPSIWSPSSIRALKGLAKKHRVDVVCTHSSIDSWLAAFASVTPGSWPPVVRMRHLSTPIRRGVNNRFLYQYVPRKVVTTSESIRARMIRANGFDGSKIVSIPTGVDTEAFRPDQPGRKVRGELGLGEGDFLVGTVGVLRDWKGHADLIEAAGILDGKGLEFTFVIAGGGPDRDVLERKIAGAGLDGVVRMLGHREDVPEVLSALDLFVFPSYANEGVPQALLQAMASGKPVVASHIEPIMEVVADGVTAVLTPPRDPSSLAEAIERLHREGELAGALGRRAREHVVEHHSLKAMTDRMEELYRDVLGDGNR